MIKIELSNASNGIIKKIIDTQFNGADRIGEIVKVYEFIDNDSEFNQDQSIRLLVDLSKDLAIDLGSEHSYKMKFVYDWGSKFNPSLKEVNERIKNLSQEIKSWKEYRKAIENYPNANII